MHIRALGPEDAAIYQDLRLRALLESPTSFSSSHADEADRPRSTVARALDPASGRTTLGAFVDGRLVGIVGVGRESGTKERHRGFIRSMYVDESARRGGIGRALMHACISVAASEPGLRQLALSVTATNAPAIELYRSLGFKVQGVVPDALYINGAYLDEWFMVLAMGDAAKPPESRHEHAARSMRLNFLALDVSDLDAALHFYRDLIGAPLHRASHDAGLRDDWYGGDHAACSWTDGAFLHFALYPARPPHRPPTTGAQVGFHVTDFDAVHARIVAAGVHVLVAPRDEPWGRTARYLDPDGNIVSITAARAG